MELIAYPFRLTPDGTSVAKVVDGSDEAIAQELAVAVLTRPGERLMRPQFGIADPAFVGFDGDALRMHVTLFGPAVELQAVAITDRDDRTQDVTVHFAPAETGAPA